MDKFQLSVNRYDQSIALLRETMDRKHQGLKRYAQGPKPKQSVIDIANREIQAVFDYIEAAEGLLALVSEENERLQHHFIETMDARDTIAKLKKDLKKAQRYIEFHGLDPHNWRWT